MELIVHLGDPFTRLGTEPRPGPQPRALLAGQLLSPLLLRPGPRVDLFAIRFEPWGARGVLGIEPGALFERLPSLEDLLGSDAPRLVDALTRAAGFPERVAAAERWLAVRLGRAGPIPRSVVEAARAAGADAELRSVADLAGHVGWGVRRLERGFAEHVGLAPKALLRVARLQRLLGHLAAPGPAPSLAALALDCGYADQAHMTREFTALVGTSPTRYRAEAHGLQDAILEPAR
jgi:AraC-like DNA-binding protein